jgi:biotin transporter BioY
VPITLQTLCAVRAGGVFGGELTLGRAGLAGGGGASALPVLATARRLAALCRQTAGFLVGMAVAAWACGGGRAQLAAGSR